MDLINDQPTGDTNRPSENHVPPAETSSSRAFNSGLTPILALVPIDEFHRLGVVPVSYNLQEKRLKLVCRVPVDDHLKNEIRRRLPDTNFEWYHVDDKVFAVMLARLTDNTPATVPPTPIESSQPVTTSETPRESEIVPAAPDSPADAIVPAAEPVAAQASTPDPIIPPGQKVVLFVNPVGRISQHLMFAFAAEHCVPITVNNLDQAAATIEKQAVACVFVHENTHGRTDQFMARMQASSPNIPIRLYRSEAALLMNETRDQVVFDLVRQNLTLFGRLNSTQGSAVSDHAASVARFADRIAVRLGVSDHCRLMIQTAAFLHNMAEQTLTSVEGLEQADIIRLSASRLQSWDFPPMVVQMLRRMYRTVGETGLQSDGAEATGGYILTAADVFCHQWPDTATAGRQMETVQRKLEDRLQWKVMPSVISTLLDVICDDCTARLLRPNRFHIHLFVSNGQVPETLREELQNSDFEVSTSTNLSECAQSCRQAKADLLIIHDSGSVTDIYDTMMSLALRGMALDQLHTVLLLSEAAVVGALRLLPHGVEEILPVTAHPRAIVTKLQRIKNRLEEQYRHRVSAIERLGTHGSLSDMCLTDILEIWRGHRRPARISVTALGNQLTVYLDRGKVVAAECGECEGMSALLRGVSWRQGIWNIDSIEPAELPEPNVDQSIDAVLIEACTRLDEVAKDEPGYALPSHAHSF